MPMDPRDHRLSTRISQRGAIPENELRRLMVNRLSATLKVIGRRSLSRSNNLGFYCEQCGTWAPEDFFPEPWDCDGCGAEYRIEVVIYEKVKDGQRVPIE